MPVAMPVLQPSIPSVVVEDTSDTIGSKPPSVLVSGSNGSQRTALRPVALSLLEQSADGARSGHLLLPAGRKRCIEPFTSDCTQETRGWLQYAVLARQVEQSDNWSLDLNGSPSGTSLATWNPQVSKATFVGNVLVDPSIHSDSGTLSTAGTAVGIPYGKLELETRPITSELRNKG